MTNVWKILDPRLRWAGTKSCRNLNAGKYWHKILATRSLYRSFIRFFSSSERVTSSFISQSFRSLLGPSSGRSLDEMRSNTKLVATAWTLLFCASDLMSWTPSSQYCPTHWQKFPLLASSSQLSPWTGLQCLLGCCTCLSYSDQSHICSVAQIPNNVSLLLNNYSCNYMLLTVKFTKIEDEAVRWKCNNQYKVYYDSLSFTETL